MSTEKSTRKTAPKTAAGTAPRDAAKESQASDGGAAARRDEIDARSAAAPLDADHHPDAVVQGPPVVTQDDPTILPAGGTLSSAPDASVRPAVTDDASDDVEGDGRWELFNPSSSPIIYDDEGHFVGGGERVRINKIVKDSPAARHIAAGRLVKSRADS